MSTINTAPMSGMRDFLPIDVLRRKYVVGIIERVYQSYGFEPLETPSMERLDTLLGKYGEEGDQLIFRVLKRGDALQKTIQHQPSENALSDGGLRFDLTVPLARVMAAYRGQLPRVFKRYQIQPVYRADRPARGRYREFFQCDVDIVGTRSPVAEAEVIGAVADVLLRLGFAGADDFTIRVNHRAVLRALMEAAGIPPALEGVTLVAVDKADKIGIAGVRQELGQRGIQEEASQRLLETLQSAPAYGERLTWLSAILAQTESGPAAVQELGQVLHCLEGTRAESRVRLDPFLARGLSYYTGPIFELAFPELGVSGGGGGRYDGLVGMFSGQQIPACGFSLGLERILLLLEERGLFPARLAGQPQVLVTQSGAEWMQAAQRLAASLRDSGLLVDLYTDMDRYGVQFQYAQKRGISYVALLGARELEAGVVAIRDLQSGQQQDLPAAAAASWLLEQLTAQQG